MRVSARLQQCCSATTLARRLRPRPAPLISCRLPVSLLKTLRASHSVASSPSGVARSRPCGACVGIARAAALRRAERAFCGRQKQQGAMAGKGAAGTIRPPHVVWSLPPGLCAGPQSSHAHAICTRAAEGCGSRFYIGRRRVARDGQQDGGACASGGGGQRGSSMSKASRQCSHLLPFRRPSGCSRGEAGEAAATNRHACCVAVDRAPMCARAPLMRCRRLTPPSPPARPYRLPRGPRAARAWHPQRSRRRTAWSAASLNSAGRSPRLRAQKCHKASQASCRGGDASRGACVAAIHVASAPSMARRMAPARLTRWKASSSSFVPPTRPRTAARHSHPCRSRHTTRGVKSPHVTGAGGR